MFNKSDKVLVLATGAVCIVTKVWEHEDPDCNMYVLDNGGVKGTSLVCYANELERTEIGNGSKK